MAIDWKEQLQDRWRKVTESRTARPAATPKRVVRAVQRTSEQAPYPISLGIDFGTSFTKVCYRLVPSERSKIVSFEMSKDLRCLPSVVYESPDGELHTSLEDLTVLGALRPYPYLKMACFGLQWASRYFAQKFEANVETENAHMLTVFYLAEVMQYAKDWIAAHEQEALTGRKVQWSATLGVPISYWKEPNADKFHHDAAAAWQLVSNSNMAHTRPALQELMAARPEGCDQALVHCAVEPEIVAAIHAFISDRQSRPGRYIYFDIGGGTFDGVAFDYVNDNGVRKVEFWKGDVQTLGVEALAERMIPLVQNDVRSQMEAVLLGQPATYDFSHLSNSVGMTRLMRDVQDVAAGVVVGAKQRDSRPWRERIEGGGNPFTRADASIPDHQCKPLPILVGGGGATSPRYMEWIEHTYADRQQGNSGIPPYSVEMVQKPEGVEIDGLEAKEFHRFTIAYGLSIPEGERPEVIGFPTELPPAGTGELRRFDFDVRSMEIYGEIS